MVFSNTSLLEYTESFKIQFGKTLDFSLHTQSAAGLCNSWHRVPGKDPVSILIHDFERIPQAGTTRLVLVTGEL